MSVTVYSWPTGAGWAPSRWEMRVANNQRVFTSPYTKTIQTIDLPGDYWTVTLDLPPDTREAVGMAREAFFDLLKGSYNQVQLYNLRRPTPRGSISGSPTLLSNTAQFANTAQLQATAGATLLAGDMIGIAGQLVRVLQDAVADGAGHLAITFAPRLRVALTAGAAITLYQPTANFILKPGGNGDAAVPVVWHPGEIEGCSMDLVEAP